MAETFNTDSRRRPKELVEPRKIPGLVVFCVALWILAAGHLSCRPIRCLIVVFSGSCLAF